MTSLKYILHSLWHFRKQNLAVIAATVISTAVLTGALIIGDSVRYTLRHMVDIRLGNTRFALPTGDRFVRSDLAYEISDNLQVNSAPILAVEGISVNPENNTRINKTNIYGIDSMFWKLASVESIVLSDDEVLINEDIAQKLDLQIGDELLLRIEKAEIIPINTPFASTENPSISLRFKVKAILNFAQMGRFSLKSNQAAPYNVFISQKYLAQKLNIEGLSNLVLVGNNQQNSINIDSINASFDKLWQLQDLGLKLKGTGEKGQYELSSNRIFIENNIGDLFDSSESQPVLTYLVNAIEKDAKETPYSFVTAITNSLTGAKLGDNEIIINDWLAQDIDAKTGDSINLTYYIIGPMRTLTEEKHQFYVKQVIPVEKSESLKSLMPDFPGISNAGSCSEWETGVPINLDKIRDKDEKYWNDFKGTPKAFISITSGKKLWINQLGSLTALRFDSLQYSPEKLRKDLKQSLKPADFGLVAIPIYDQGVQATINAVDFGQLFLSLSFFVIIAGVLLTILIHVFNSGTRHSETGLLSGLGFTKGYILRLRIFESLFVIVPAGILGALLGILYNYLIMAGINSVWNDVVRTNMIELDIKLRTLLIGSISGIFISLISIYFTSRKILKQQVALSVKDNLHILFSTKKTQLTKYLSFLSILAAILVLIYSIGTSIEKNSGMFLISGALFLVGIVLSISCYFDILIKRQSGNVLSTNKLILKNLGRNKSQSIKSILLLALGAFVIMITGANRKTFFEADYSNQSGTGGYLLWAETSIPVPYNLNTDEGLKKMGFSKGELPQNLKFSQFYSIEGDDASCLNLNQVQKPRILGVNAKEFDQRNSFSFASFHESVNKSNPWLSLYHSDKGVMPAVADQTVLVWGLKKSVGDTLIYLNEKGEKINILIVGALNNSIFQGNLLISDSLFQLNFPSNGGSNFMLLDAPQNEEKQITAAVNNGLIDYGIELSPASQRLAQFNSVTNTYLSVFMALGGLGMLIGTIGLGIVLLRNLQERRSELALMMALGFTKGKLISIIIKENLYLLVSGMFIGIIAAFFGILPSVVSPSFEIPGVFMFVLILLVFANGFLWIYFPVKYAVNANIISTLKEE
jgi:ABC-type antimicrobial peptide transport system permease subunit